jgi:3-oxoacyl-[acyl-carrier-protein] synthase-1
MLSVTALGMVSPLSLDAASSCAGARAGVQRPISTDDLFLPDPDEGGLESLKVSLRRVPVVSAGFFGLGRRAQLGLAALADLQRSAGRLDDCRAGFILLVGNDVYRTAWARRARQAPELAGDTDLDQYDASVQSLHDRYLAELLALLVRRSGMVFEGKARKTVCATAVGLTAALRQAEEWLEGRACDRCVIGAVDSLIDPFTLQALARLGVLKTAEQPVGFAPGEAAAFVVVETARAARSRRAAVQAVLEGHATGAAAPNPLLQEDPGTDEGLPTAVAQSLAASDEPGRAPALAVVNLNGDTYRARGWGETAVRPQLAGLRAAPVWIPALSFGEIGAAAGLVSLAMLARGWARGYAPDARAMICLMDDVGGRAAVSVSPPS